MYVWDVSLNAISMINLVMAIGFAVDYSAHVAHFFVFSVKNSPEEKVIDSLRTVGASVFMGGRFLCLRLFLNRCKIIVMFKLNRDSDYTRANVSRYISR